MGITLSQKQINVLTEPLHDLNVLVGVTMSSKSYIANLRWYHMICSAPKKSLFLQSGNTSESLYDNVTAKLLENDKGINALEYGTIEGRKRLIVKPTGTEVACIGADDNNSYMRIRGKNLRGWYADEVTKQPKSFVQQASVCCRSVINGKLVITPMLWTLNPDSPLHYIKKEFLDNPKIDVKQWNFNFYDNPLMTEELIEKLKGRYTGVFYQRMIEGKWTIAQGIVYNNFDPGFHIVSDYPKNAIKRYIVGIDWGYEHPMVLSLLGQTDEGVYYLIDSIYLYHQIFNDSLKAKIQDEGWFDLKIEKAYGDPSRPEYIQQFEDITGIDTVPADNDVIEGIQEVQKKLNIDKNKRCQFYILEKNKRIIEEFQNYHWKENKDGTTRDEPVKELDDGVDSVRYPIYSDRYNFNMNNLPLLETQPLGESKRWQELKIS